MATLQNRLEELLRQKLDIGSGGRLPSQTTIAKEMGVAQTTVSRWLNQKIDRFDSDTLVKMCTYLECNVGDLIFLDFDEA